MRSLLLLLVALSLCDGGSWAYRILAVLPHIGRSHFDVFEPYLKQLALRGHHVVVLSHFPQRVAFPNYTDVDVSGSLPGVAHTEVFAFHDIESSSVLKDSLVLSRLGLETCERVLSSDGARRLLASDQRFDLVVYELFNTDCFLGFAHRFRAPTIAVSSSTFMPWGCDRFANPDSPAYVSHGAAWRGDSMTFAERLVNTVHLTAYKALYKLLFDMPGNRVARRHFGDDLPPLESLARNTSLVLVNTHFSLNRPRPLLPAVVEIGGIHLRPPAPLPKDLDELLSGAKHGVVYFSMGSMIRADSFPADKARAFLAAFAILPQTVVWKWGGQPLQNTPANVHFRRWLPQQDVLCNPNVIAFVSHGGLLGTIEAAHCGVPMVGMPMYGDQPANVGAVVGAGMAVRLSYSDITTANVLQALHAVINDTQPLSPADTAVYWTEYIIRHGGAAYMRSAALDLAWYEYLLLDVAATITIAASCIGYLVYIVVKKILHICTPSTIHKLKSN
ncbi:hypothetical protein PR048_025315 [Dryococelus australis]|uniref:UDP-glucuronosyltransferase n=1 Tax=Dryococelus australis TaxID=614101 RepID=A0ABQ9GR19_9NEOP|nr:hypothetical protein PR048_025315 [Dryococelus australis]